jgi:hypothetical protein
MSETLHSIGINHNHAFWLVHHMPFMPEFEPDGDNFKIKFNEGYVYDYANGGKRLKVEPDEEFTIGQTEDKEFKIQLKIDKFTGAISEAKILEGSNDGGLADFTNLQNRSDVEGFTSGSDDEEQQIMLDLMELSGPSINEQYIRENIHIWLRGFYQKGSSEGGHAPLKKDPSAGANDMIEIRELREKDEEDNILEITTEGDSIVFYVPEGSCCDDSNGSDSGSDKSTAIVPMDWHEKGYGALFTMESNEVLFEFVMRNVSLVGSKTVVAIDDRFLKVCEPDSMVITGVTGDKAGSVGAVVEKNNVILSAWPLSFLRPTKVTLKLTGIRKGFKRYDMPERSREQFIANEEFINSAYPKE